MSFVSDSSNSNNKDIDLLNEETSKTSNQEHDELKTEKKKKRIIRKKNRYQELLEDTFLFHIGEKKKSNNFPQLNEEVRKMLNKKSIYHGKPMIVLGVGLDQFNTASFVKKYNMGISFQSRKNIKRKFSSY